MPRPTAPARSPTQPPAGGDATPWWRIGMVWLVLGGPLTVVVAALVTAAIAASGPDDVLPQPGASGASAPAIQARNHAASPRR